jgi:hypothetical protein
MSSARTRSWVANLNVMGDVEHDVSDDFWKRDQGFKEWVRTLEYAQRRISTSKTNFRIKFIRDEILSLVRHGGKLFQRLTAYSMH